MSLICPICQDNLVNSESIDNFVNKCGHVYHSACLLPWWDQHHGADPTCPECRQPCHMDTIQKIYFTLDATEDGNAGALPSQVASGGNDVAHEAMLRQIKEYITLQTCSQTKDLNDKFRAQSTEFSSLMLNSSQRLTSNYNDKLTSVSKDLTDVITTENQRLLTKLVGNPAGGSQSSPPRKSAMALTVDEGDALDTPETSFNYKHLAPNRCTGRQLNYIAIGIAVMCLIAVIGYSHFILHAVKKTEFSGEEKTSNVSKGLQQLSRELSNVASTVNQNQRDMHDKMDVLHELLRTGINTRAVTARLNDLTDKLDKLLLEQIQTDRRTDLKLNVLQNEVSMVAAQIEAGLRKNMTQASANQRDGTLEKLRQDNQSLQEKLQHLQRIISNSTNASTVQVRRTIEADPLLTPQSQRQAKNLWDKFTMAIGVDSGCGIVSAQIVYVMAMTFAAMLLQFGRN